ncbi:hypothetical protein [Antrihabitans stalactiti]|uniref:Uncharacterized protein n=1 Tax=Antrihabitans stalactiti TaxID=2584121 RepID=A0A848KKS6_9NOCA|nr:hypothetical protein [Antrihabitans stalactiti]NMN99285.1 hypothetical protein [Antrihabitans stalactiti]
MVNADEMKFRDLGRLFDLFEDMAASAQSISPDGRKRESQFSNQRLMLAVSAMVGVANDQTAVLNILRERARTGGNAARVSRGGAGISRGAQQGTGELRGLLTEFGRGLRYADRGPRPDRRLGGSARGVTQTGSFR